MDIKVITESNREAWNEAITYHQKARKKSLQEGFSDSSYSTLNRDCDDILIPKLKEINLDGKTISQLPCNNGRELLSLMRLGAQRAVGFDISDVAIKEAQELADIAKINATFERTNILEIDSTYDDMFDFIYISEGSLQWFPDLNEYFKVASRLLKKDGKILIYEMHPFAYFFEQAFELNREVQLEDFISYFGKEPYSYKYGLDYIGQTIYKAKKCYWFMHKISDILNAITKSNIEMLEFNEYNQEMGNNENIKHKDKFPLSYILTGKKK